MQLLNTLKRLVNGPTTYFVVKQGSTSLKGNSFVELYRERIEYPTTIISIDIKIERNTVAEWRIMCDGEKVFPFSQVNQIQNGIVNIIPVEISAGSLLTIEVKGTNPKAANVVILSECCMIIKK